MAQLRDIATSQLLTEGTPAEVAYAASQLEADSYLFDGVGEAFDPDATLGALEDNLAGLEAAAAEESSSEASDRFHRQVNDARKSLEAVAKKAKSERARLNGG